MLTLQCLSPELDEYFWVTLASQEVSEWKHRVALEERGWAESYLFAVSFSPSSSDFGSIWSQINAATALTGKSGSAGGSVVHLAQELLTSCAASYSRHEVFLGRDEGLYVNGADSGWSDTLVFRVNV